MISIIRRGGRLPLRAIASGLGVWWLSVSSVLAQEGMPSNAVPNWTGQKVARHLAWHKTSGGGTLGYGPPGIFPGYQGFGLDFHRGYGYGGDALGVGCFGGYPFYGGPGYPHPWPCLNRFGPLTPFAYFGGPGYPTPDHPNFFGGVAGLAPDKPVITFESAPGQPAYDGDYGGFTGAIPYSEFAFAPFATMSGETGTYRETGPVTPPVDPTHTPPPPVRTLGIDVEPSVIAGLAPGLKITSLLASGIAGKAGLHVGDVIVSMNGYVTQKPTDLTWILANAATNNILKLRVRIAGDSREQEVTTQIP